MSLLTQLQAKFAAEAPQTTTSGQTTDSKELLTRMDKMLALLGMLLKGQGDMEVTLDGQKLGKVLKKPMIETSEAEYDEMAAVNSKTAFFFLKESGRHVNDNGKVLTLVTSLLGAFTPFYASYEGMKAPVEHFTRAAAKEFGERGISVNAIGPGPMDTPFFYPAEGADAVAYHKSAAALSKFSKTGLTDIQDIVPWVRLLVSDGWWMTGQTILVNGGYTTK